MERVPSYTPAERTSYPESGGDWNALLAQYGHAMMRLGHLEKEVSDLQQKLQESQSTGSAEAQATPGEMEKELRRKDDTIASLRLQVATLNNQLSRTQANLKLAAEGNYIRHRRRHRSPWWMVWKQRR